MTQAHIFDNIEKEELDKMIICFNAQIKSFPAHKKLMSYSSHSMTLGVLLSGEADLIKYDYDGCRSIVEHLSEQDIFGSILLPPTYAHQIEAISSVDCQVLLFDYNQLIKRCSNACSYHSTLVSNVLQIFSFKTRQFHSRIEILSQRSIRNKLLTYFTQLALQNDSTTFTLPFTLNSMADYLFVDRSAMLREMKKMRDEALISSKGRRIKLLLRE